MERKKDRKVIILQATAIAIVIVGMVFITRTLKGVQPNVK